MLSEQDRKAALEALAEYINQWGHNTIDKTSLELERDALLHGYELGMQAGAKAATMAAYTRSQWICQDIADSYMTQKDGFVVIRCAEAIRQRAKEMLVSDEGDKP